LLMNTDIRLRGQRVNKTEDEHLEQPVHVDQESKTVRLARQEGSRPPRGGERRPATTSARTPVLLRRSLPARKLLIPLERRDVRVVEGARWESNSGDRC
jgi:hypothetical protein